MLDLLRRRRSIRVFTDQPVEEDKKQDLLKAALLAPSSKNKKSAELLVIEDRAVIRRMAGCKKFGSTPLETAPLAIVVMADHEKSDVWVEDASLAAFCIQLEAESLGLGSTWVQIRRREGDEGPADAVLKRELSIPENRSILCVIACGYKNEEKQPYTDEDLDWSKVHDGSL